MALISAVLSLPDIVSTSTNSSTLTTVTSTSAITVIPDRQIAVNANQDMTIRFTQSAAITAALATDLRIPANQTFVFTIGHDTQNMYFYNLSGSTLTYWWQYLSKF